MAAFRPRTLADLATDGLLLPRDVRPRVGLFSIGLAEYWLQFPGLRERLESYRESVERQLRASGADVVALGLVDTPQAARQAADRVGAERLDLLFVYSATYATSAQILPVVQAAQAPTVILNLQPSASLDYANVTTAEWLASCAACGVPELAGTLSRVGIDYAVVTGTLDGTEAWSEIAEWLSAAVAVSSLRRSRFGFLGHNYPGMLDMYSDFTQIQGALRCHVEVLEMDDLIARIEDASPDEVQAKRAEIEARFDFAEPGVDPIAGPITEEQLQWSAQVATGLDALVSDFFLDGLTYYYRGLRGNLNERVAAGLIVGNSLLTARGVPTSGEADLKTNIAMLLLDRLGAGGSYTEFYALDFTEGFILMGHDGPGHVAISDERPVLRALKLYHGKSGAGLSVEFRVRLGPVTIVGLTQTYDGRLKLVAAEGESIPGELFRIGNTNSRIRFEQSPAAFMNSWCALGPTHHVALGTGHQISVLEKIALLLDIELDVAGFL